MEVGSQSSEKNSASKRKAVKMARSQAFSERGVETPKFKNI